MGTGLWLSATICSFGFAGKGSPRQAKRCCNTFCQLPGREHDFGMRWLTWVSHSGSKWSLPARLPARLPRQAHSPGSGQVLLRLAPDTGAAGESLERHWLGSGSALLGTDAPKIHPPGGKAPGLHFFL